MWERKGCECQWCLSLERSIQKNAPPVSSRAASTSKSRPPPPRAPKPQTPNVNNQQRKSSARKPPPPNRPKPAGSIVKKQSTEKKAPETKEKKKNKYVERWQCENCMWANNVEDICKTTGCGTKRPPRYVVGEDPTGLYEEEDEAFLAMKKAEEELTAWLKSEPGKGENSSNANGGGMFSDVLEQILHDDDEASDILPPLIESTRDNENKEQSQNDKNDGEVPGGSLVTPDSPAMNGAPPRKRKRRLSTAVRKKAQDDLVFQLRQQVAQLQDENRTIQDTLKNDMISAAAESSVLVEQLQEQVLHLQNENTVLQEKIISQAADSSKKLALVEEAFLKQSSELQRRERDVKFLRQQLKLLLGSKSAYH